MDGWMNGARDGRDGRMAGWMDGRMRGSIDGWMDETGWDDKGWDGLLQDGWRERGMDRWMYLYVSLQL